MQWIQQQAANALNALRAPLPWGHLELEPQKRTGSGTFLPGLLYSVIKSTRNLSLSRHVYKLHLGTGSAGDISAPGGMTHAPTETGQIPRPVGTRAFIRLLAH